MIKVRFAPSPTGHLHVGGARTALFNWLFARSNNGKFLLRIEDTDVKRSKEKYLKSILNSMEWLGLDYDEELVFQSKRNDLYRKCANQLIKEGKAYKATHRKREENSEQEQNEAIYFKTPQQEVFFYDKIHDKVTFNTKTIKDIVLIKSDGSPAYNFACVIDDIDMEISHVIRGDDHISNTPKQLLLYEALNKETPKFAHLPLILGPDNTRLSKRHGATSVEEFREKGFVPQAMFNYLALLGWSPGGDQEIVSKKKIIQKFSLNKVNKVNAVFDIDKLRWVNSNYIKQKSPGELTELVIPYLEKRGYDVSRYDRKWLEDVISLYNTRFKTLEDVGELAGFFFTDNFNWQEEAVDKYLKEANKKVLKKYVECLSNLEDFNRDKLEKATRKFAEEEDVSLGKIALPVRVMITGRSVSPGIFKVMILLGKDKVIQRMEYALENRIK